MILLGPFQLKMLCNSVILLYLIAASFPEQQFLLSLLEMTLRLPFALTFSCGQTIDLTFPGLHW